MTAGRRPAGFRRVWLGATISATGDAASWIALVALIVAAPRASITILAVCYTAPVAGGGLAAGWALDRFDRRRLLAADAVVRAAVFALVPVSAAAGALPVPLLCAVAAVYGLLKMISLAGFPAMIPQLVDAEELSRANALEGAAYGLASLAGAGLGGLAVGALGYRGAVGLVAFDAVSYLVFAGLLVTVRPAPATRDPRGDAVPPGLNRAEKQELLRHATTEKIRNGGGKLVHLTPEPQFPLPWQRRPHAELRHRQKRRAKSFAGLYLFLTIQT